MRILALPVVAASCIACGSNNADVPPALLDAIKHPAGGSGSYPAGPYGTQVGDIAQNQCFSGWTDPSAADFDTNAMKPICLGDYYGAAGQGAKLLLVDSSAVWCVACKVEYQGSGSVPSLTKRLEERRSQGFRVLGTIYQNAEQGDAAPTDAAAWARAYNLSFPFALDLHHQLGIFAPPNVAPFNMLIDTQEMKIVYEVLGDEAAVLFQQVDDFLATHAGP